MLPNTMLYRQIIPAECSQRQMITKTNAPSSMQMILWRMLPRLMLPVQMLSRQIYAPSQMLPGRIVPTLGAYWYQSIWSSYCVEIWPGSIFLEHCSEEHLSGEHLTKEHLSLEHLPLSQLTGEHMSRRAFVLRVICMGWFSGEHLSLGAYCHYPTTCLKINPRPRAIQSKKLTINDPPDLVPFSGTLHQLARRPNLKKGQYSKNHQKLPKISKYTGIKSGQNYNMKYRVRAGK